MGWRADLAADVWEENRRSVGLENMSVGVGVDCLKAAGNDSSISLLNSYTDGCCEFFNERIVFLWGVSISVGRQ